MVRFTELNPSAYKDSILIVDIDGTVTNDRNPAVALAAKQQLKEMAKHARVYLCSNSRSTTRFHELARETGATYLGTALRKPDPRILQLIPEHVGKRIVVIGDKYLTDGRFAKKIGAEFIKTARITGSSDRASIRVTYMLDDAYSGLRAIGMAATAYIELMRPTQWIKNLLVFSPMFFAVKMNDVLVLSQSIAAFAVFSLAASAVYVMNDIADAENDRAHPHKRHRPIARNAVHKMKAAVFAGMLLAVLVVGLVFVPAVVPVALIYLALNVLYSFRLKHVAVVDITLVALFYVLRVVAGGAATGLSLSPWIILCVLFGSLFIVAGKRRAELAHEKRRKVLDEYSPATLDGLLVISAGLAIISYGLYSILGHDSPLLVYSTFFVVFALFRMFNDIHTRARDAESPEILVFKDRWVLTSVALWTGYVFLAFYFSPIV